MSLGHCEDKVAVLVYHATEVQQTKKTQKMGFSVYVLLQPDEQAELGPTV